MLARSPELLTLRALQGPLSPLLIEHDPPVGLERLLPHVQGSFLGLLRHNQPRVLPHGDPVADVVQVASELVQPGKAHEPSAESQVGLGVL